MKNMPALLRKHSKMQGLNQNVRFFFRPPTLNSGNFAAPLATRMQSTSFTIFKNFKWFIT